MTLPDVTLGQYKILFDLTGAHDLTLTQTIKVVDKITIKSVSYKLGSTKTFPSKLEDTVKYPAKLTGVKEANDGQYLHLTVSAKFEKSTETP